MTYNVSVKKSIISLSIFFAFIVPLFGQTYLLPTGQTYIRTNIMILVVIKLIEM